jgi:hypothetical protein
VIQTKFKILAIWILNQYILREQITPTVSQTHMKDNRQLKNNRMRSRERRLGDKEEVGGKF